MLFVTHLAAANISRTTIKVYLLGIYYVHVIAGLHNSFNEQLTPQFQLVICGIKKSQALTTQSQVANHSSNNAKHQVNTIQSTTLIW